MPTTPSVYVAAFNGCLIGLAASGKYLNDPNAGDYAYYTAQAKAFATQIDVAWTASGTPSPTCSEINSLQAAATGVWSSDRSPLQSSAANVPGNYAGVATAIVALVQQGNAQLVLDGVDPNAACDVGGGGGGAAPSNIIVYKPGAVPSGNIYATWAAAYAARLLVSGPATIAVDVSITNPAPVPAGTYNLAGTKLLGLSTGITPLPNVLSLADGVTFTNVTDLENIEIDCNNVAGAVVSLSAGTTTVVLRNSIIQPQAAGAFWNVNSGAVLIVDLFDMSQLDFGAVTITGASFVVVNETAASSVQANAVTGTTGGLTVNFDDSSTVDTTGFTGAIAVNPLSDARAVLFSPTTPGNWSPAPTLVGPALDQLAARPSLASRTFTEFFALMPGDNAATVAVGAPVLFPQDGPTSGAATRVDNGSFTIVATGTYRIGTQVSVTEAGQLQLAVGGVGLPDTVAGRAMMTSQIVIDAIVTLTAGDVLSVINPTGNAAALTITPIAGGTHAVSATLSIERVG
jgi:hypothetical protein